MKPTNHALQSKIEAVVDKAVALEKQAEATKLHKAYAAKEITFECYDRELKILEGRE